MTDKNLGKTIFTHVTALGVGLLVGILACSIDAEPIQVKPQEEVVPQAVKSDDSFGSVVVDEITSVYDGDTFKANIDDWPDLVGESIGIRVNGIDTPERRGTSENIKALAAEARQHTVTLLRAAEVVELRNIQRGKYFRIIADVYCDNTSLADTLIEKGLAKPYDGGTRPQWTQEDYDVYFRN